MTVRAFAKINLALDILGQDPSGFHTIQTVYHELPGLFDEIIIKPANRVAVECDNPEVPQDETNTALKAARLLRQYAEKLKEKRQERCASCPWSLGAKIIIKKKIPMFAGLGGGSTNAAATLKGLNELWRLGLPIEQLQRLGCQIGMDVPFFFVGGTALGTHFGNVIEPLPPLPPQIQFSIIDTGIKVASQWAYTHVNMSRCGKHKGKTAALIDALRSGDSAGVIANVHNDFEPLLFKTHPELMRFRDEALGEGAQKVWLTGSGGALVVVEHG